MTFLEFFSVLYPFYFKMPCATGRALTYLQSSVKCKIYLGRKTKHQTAMALDYVWYDVRVQRDIQMWFKQCLATSRCDDSHVVSSVYSYALTNTSILEIVYWHIVSNHRGNIVCDILDMISLSKGCHKRQGLNHTPRSAITWFEEGGGRGGDCNRSVLYHHPALCGISHIYRATKNTSYESVQLKYG